MKKFSLLTVILLFFAFDGTVNIASANSASSNYNRCYIREGDNVYGKILYNIDCK